MVDLMVFRYGGHTHPAGEVNLVRMEIRAIVNKRNERWGSRTRMHIHGEICDTGQAALKTKIQELIDAYSVNDQLACLYHSDGITPSPHVLDPGDPNNVSGVKVINRQWPRGEADEYATVRTFSVVLESLLRNPDSLLMDFQETVRAIGTGGPVWTWGHPRLAAVPDSQQFIHKLASHQRVAQFGTALGLTIYPTGNIPPPVYPQYEHEEQRVMHFGAPQWMGQQHQFYPVRWSYSMDLPLGTSIPPPGIIGNI